MKNFGALTLAATIAWGGISAEAQTKAKAQTVNRVQNVAQYKVAQNAQAPVQQTTAPQAASAAMTTTVGTQTALKPQDSLIQVAPILGATYSTLAGVEVKNGDGSKGEIQNVSGMQGGATVAIGRGALQLETGLIYAERGGTLKGKGAGFGFGPVVDSEINLKFKYLEIPALAKYSVQARSQTHVFFKGGAVFGLLQEAKMDVKNNNFNNTGFTTGTSGNADAKDKIQDFDGRLLAGVGVDIRLMKSMSLTLAADFQYGLTKINKDNFLSADSIYNSGLGATAGLLFDL